MLNFLLRDSIKKNSIECGFAVVNNIRFSLIKVQIIFVANYYIEILSISYTEIL